MSRYLEGMIDDYTSLPLTGLLIFIGFFLAVVVTVMFVHKKSDYVQVASLPLQDDGEVQQ
ncbi:MAG: cbb3-type cytochrome c oxidase subunit 3 [Cystobacterineae bacterium]|nr:cbb3-type cytochrome c oxidase subunit 3 [Cystobacterineae bacterium]